MGADVLLNSIAAPCCCGKTVDLRMTSDEHEHNCYSLPSIDAANTAVQGSSRVLMCCCLHTTAVWIVQESYGSYSSRTDRTAVVRIVQQSYGSYSSRTDRTAVVRIVQQSYGSYSSRADRTAVVDLPRHEFALVRTSTRTPGVTLATAVQNGPNVSAAACILVRTVPHEFAAVRLLYVHGWFCTRSCVWKCVDCYKCNAENRRHVQVRPLAPEDCCSHERSSNIVNMSNDRTYANTNTRRYSYEYEPYLTLLSHLMHPQGSPKTAWAGSAHHRRRRSRSSAKAGACSGAVNGLNLRSFRRERDGSSTGLAAAIRPG